MFNPSVDQDPSKVKQVPVGNQTQQTVREVDNDADSQQFSTWMENSFDIYDKWKQRLEFED